jgi:UDP-N-acetylglucosamine 3-dehydrogenase
VISEVCVADSTIRIGILGAGAMGAEHAAVYANIADVKVVGVFARDLERARSVAALCEAEPFTDAEALIQNAAVEAIDVCVPSMVHHTFVIPALVHGKHVFCETPLALHLDDAQQMLKAARRANRLLQVGLLMRSAAAYEHVKVAVSSEEYGRLLSLTTYRLGSYLRPGAPDYRAHYSDPSTELLTFDFDFAQWLMGRPTRLSASAVRTAQGSPGEISALLSYEEGRHATLVASGLMPRGFPFSVGFRALFEHAAFELQTVFEDGPPRSKFTVINDHTSPQLVRIPNRNPYQVELQRFVDCIRGRADVRLLDAERAVEALILSTATQRALDEARSIEISAVH